MMNRDDSLSVEQRQHLKIINRSGEHLLSLINDVLEMSKIEAGRMSFHENHFDLWSMIESITEMLQLKASAKNLQLILECDANIPKYVITDEGKLRQVLLILSKMPLSLLKKVGSNYGFILAQSRPRFFLKFQTQGQG